MTTASIVLYLIGLALALGGGAFTMLNFRESRTKASWPTTGARVTSSGISGVRTSNGGTFDRYQIDFGYRVDDLPFQSLIYSDKARDFPALEAKYTDGAAFPVFYNPAKPAHCEVRDRLGKMGGWSWSLIAYLFYFAAGLMLLFGWVAGSAAPQ